jgi:hypothetical protein
MVHQGREDGFCIRLQRPPPPTQRYRRRRSLWEAGLVVAEDLLGGPSVQHWSRTTTSDQRAQLIGHGRGRLPRSHPRKALFDCSSHRHGDRFAGRGGKFAGEPVSTRVFDVQGHPGHTIRQTSSHAGCSPGKEGRHQVVRASSIVFPRPVLVRARPRVPGPHPLGRAASTTPRQDTHGSGHRAVHRAGSGAIRLPISPGAQPAAFRLSTSSGSKTAPIGPDGSARRRRYHRP